MALQYLKYGVKLPQNEALHPKMILCTIYGKTKHKWDVSNSWETVQDLLVDANIIPDDNYEYVNKLVLFFGGIEKDNPRSEIFIYY